ncbi:zinc finger CCCH domain-containing protein 3 [Gastrolobium bilobum]|uniref:zinc finger CCCH domain-containing protein 3 n=1 Tax=Gastrolobium bilobum TaxID=150636 RepID=UPI002AB2A118|nr:zinc finger CCCH domain-containing protein 3 [Gastrolobium bilobum]
MPVRKYYCDYCDKQFQDTTADRKRHVRGIQHQQAKARWYDSFKLQHQQPIPPPKPLCFHFLNTGFCRYGDSCKYIHPNAPNNMQQPQPIISTPPIGNVVRDSMGVSWGNLPPSLQPPPEGGYPHLPFVDWG